MLDYSPDSFGLMEVHWSWMHNAKVLGTFSSVLVVVNCSYGFELLVVCATQICKDFVIIANCSKMVCSVLKSFITFVAQGEYYNFDLCVG